MTRDIPIIFSAPMVRALIEGRKTMTRRLATAVRKTRNPAIGESETYSAPSPWQNVKPGDRLYVRENFSGPHAWQSVPLAGWGWDTMTRPPLWFWADGNPEDGDWTKPKPSIHMPRWASRLTLIATATKTENLQEIPLRDVWAEGCEVRQFWLFGADGPERQRIGANVFGALWSELHGAESWAANPLVVALTFRVVRANIDSKEAQL